MCVSSPATGRLRGPSIVRRRSRSVCSRRAAQSYSPSAWYTVAITPATSDWTSGWVRSCPSMRCAPASSTCRSDGSRPAFRSGSAAERIVLRKSFTASALRASRPAAAPATSSPRVRRLASGRRAPRRTRRRDGARGTSRRGTDTASPRERQSADRRDGGARRPRRPPPTDTAARAPCAGLEHDAIEIAAQTASRVDGDGHAAARRGRYLLEDRTLELADRGRLARR